MHHGWRAKIFYSSSLAKAELSDVCPVSDLTESSLCTAGDYKKHVREASPHIHNGVKMDAKQKKKASSSGCPSMKSDNSKEEPPYFSKEEGYVYNFCHHFPSVWSNTT